MCTLINLHLNATSQDLAYHFNVHHSIVSRILLHDVAYSNRCTTTTTGHVAWERERERAYGEQYQSIFEHCLETRWLLSLTASKYSLSSHQTCLLVQVHGHLTNTTVELSSWLVLPYKGLYHSSPMLGVEERATSIWLSIVVFWTRSFQEMSFYSWSRIWCIWLSWYATGKATSSSLYKRENSTLFSWEWGNPVYC